MEDSLAARARDLQPALPNSFGMFGRHVDEGDVVADLVQVGANRPPYRARPDYRDMGISQILHSTPFSEGPTEVDPGAARTLRSSAHRGTAQPRSRAARRRHPCPQARPTTARAPASCAHVR